MQEETWALDSVKAAALCKLKRKREAKPSTPAAAATSSTATKQPKRNKKGKAKAEGESKEVKLNFGRLESLLRLLYLMFHFNTRTWVLEHAEVWCQQHDWYSPLYVFLWPHGLQRQEYHLSLLSDNVPGFRAVWFHYELDLHYAVWPFWCWEEGSPIELIAALPYIACYMAYYGRPTLTKVALLMLQQIVHYCDVSSEGRPDLLVLLCQNCTFLNERLIELHHSNQSRSISWTGARNIDHFKRNTNLVAARKDLQERARWARHAHQKESSGQIRTIHQRLLTGQANEQTRQLIMERQKEEFRTAAAGGRVDLKNAPIKIEIGYSKIPALIHSLDTYLDSAADQIDPLLLSEHEELKTWCRNNGINLAEVLEGGKAFAIAQGQPPPHHVLLKTDLAKCLRNIGFTGPGETVDEQDVL